MNFYIHMKYCSQICSKFHFEKWKYRSLKAKITFHYSKILICEHDSFQKNACNPKHSYIKVNFKNHWLSLASHATHIARHRSFIKLKFYQKCLLILRNTHRTNYSQLKVLLYLDYIPDPCYPIEMQRERCLAGSVGGARSS